MVDTEQRAEHWMQKAEEAFEFDVHTAYWFESGALEEKRKAMTRHGSNLILKDGKFNGKEKNTDFSSVISSWQGT